MDKRFILISLLVFYIAYSFWTGSRYPELGIKASMGMISDLNSMGLDVKWEGKYDDPGWLSITKATVNWLYANKKGMRFGILLAAGVMTIMMLIPTRNFQNPYANSVAGFFLGAPLGVCINCATPIMRGMHAGGSRLETSMAAMFASPAFNVIVVSMVFAFFPLHMAISKILFSLALILVGVPLIIRALGLSNVNSEVMADKLVCENGDGSKPKAYGWVDSAIWTLTNYLKNLWKVFYMTVPFMVLAGFLGAVILHFLPVDWFQQITPANPNLVTVMLMMLAIAFVGTFLPIPMAMDVLLAAALFSAGVPVHFVMPLLFTAGIYSIYPLLIISKDISPKLGFTFYGVVTALGFLAGMIAYQMEKAHHYEMEHFFVQELAHGDPTPADPAPETPTGTPADTVLASLAGKEQTWNSVSPENAPTGITIQSSPYLPSDHNTGSGFARSRGTELGIDAPYFNTTDKLMTFLGVYKRGIASGDVHGDGWPDLLVAGDHSMGRAYLYANQQGQFVHQELDFGDLASAPVIDLALVDLDNDGWLDIYFTTFEDGVWFWKNQDGKFLPGGMKLLYQNPDATVAATGFGDLNHDGRLDLVLGNWTYSWGIAFVEGTSISSRNVVLWSQPDGTYKEETLPGEPGETLSILISDLNGDTYEDVLIGNDFDEPDEVYLGNAEGTLTMVNKLNGPIPVTTTFTMSYDSADLNNDLRPEIFGANIAIGGVNRRGKNSVLALDAWETFDDPDLQEEHSLYMRKIAMMLPWQKPSTWRQMNDARVKENSLATHVFLSSLRRNHREWLDFVPPHREDLQTVAHRGKIELYRPTNEELATEIPQVQQRNVLLSPVGARYQDTTKDWGLEFTGWTWNAKFADLNNDSWQDLYLVNGYLSDRRRETNRLFLNQAGETMKDVTKDAHLTDYLATSSYTYVDYDFDGDLDIVYVPIDGPLQVCENQYEQRQSIRFQLRDDTGNAYAIGAKVQIHYGESESLGQMRELRWSGGYSSFDAPEAHFGLGEEQSVSKVVITWPDKSTTTLDGPFEAGHCYRVSRSSN